MAASAHVSYARAQARVTRGAFQDFEFFLKSMMRPVHHPKIMFDEGSTLAILDHFGRVNCGAEAARMLKLLRAELELVPCEAPPAGATAPPHRQVVQGGVRRPRPACYHSAIQACVGAFHAQSRCSHCSAR